MDLRSHANKLVAIYSPWVMPIAPLNGGGTLSCMEHSFAWVMSCVSPQERRKPSTHKILSQYSHSCPAQFRLPSPSLLFEIGRTAKISAGSISGTTGKLELCCAAAFPSMKVISVCFACDRSAFEAFVRELFWRVCIFGFVIYECVSHLHLSVVPHCSLRSSSFQDVSKARAFCSQVKRCNAVKQSTHSIFWYRCEIKIHSHH